MLRLVGVPVVILTFGLTLSGCATVVRGTTESVAFDSQPAGAEVRLSTGPACTTPCALVVKRNEEFIATFTKPGFRAQQVEVKTQLTGGGAAAGAGNILAGGVIGIGVDAATGATLDHTPNPVQVTLVPERAPAPAPAARRRSNEDPKQLGY